jgi:multiple sugar transport system substrate-binding protein
MMVYNKDLMDANEAAIIAAIGEPFPDDRPLTWAELDLLADILVDPNWDADNPTANKCEYLINFDSAANFFINNVRMWGGGYTNSAGDILVDDAVTKQMLGYVQDRFEDKTFAIPLAWGQEYGSEDFIAGNSCMSVGSTAGVNYNIPSDGAFEVGIGPVPQYDLDNKSAVQQGPNISIMSKTTDAERLVAWEFIKFLINSENTAAWAMDTGYLPVSYSGYNSDEYQAFLAIDSLTNSRYYTSLAAQAAALQRDYFKYDPAFSGAYSSSDARDQANLAMEALFGGYSVDSVIDYMLSQLGS